MKKKIITICASTSFFKKVLQIAKILKQIGYQVKVPLTASVMERKNDFEVSHYKSWFKDGKYKRKTYLTKKHFEKVEESDAILVVNFDKDKIKGYIGGSTLMEMAIAFYLKKPIYILNHSSSKLSFYEEIMALNPIFLDGDLKKVAL